MNDPRHGWEDRDDEPSAQSRLANRHRLPFRVFWPVVSVALRALLILSLAVATGMAVIP